MGKHILVSGGNRGIGLGICKELATRGHSVMLGSRSVESGQHAASQMTGSVDVCQLDVSKEEDIANAFDHVGQKWGKLDVLINNAGIGIGNRGSVDADMAEIREIMNVNFFGAWRLSQVMIPLLNKSQDGRIINMSSGMGALEDLTGGYAGYRMSKSAMNALTILMSNELRGDGIRVNAMCPGWVRTDMGGAGASRSVEKGAETAVWLSLEDNIPTGKFFRDMKVIPW